MPKVAGIGAIVHDLISVGGQQMQNALYQEAFIEERSRVWTLHRKPQTLNPQLSTLLIRLNEYGSSGPCLGMAWADTDNPVY